MIRRNPLKSMAPKRPRRRLAFTLIELAFVSIALGALALVIFPAFANARHRAQESSVRNSLLGYLYQIGVFTNQSRRLPTVADLANRDYFDFPHLDGNKWDDGIAEYTYLYPPHEPPGDEGFDGKLSSIEHPAETILIIAKLEETGCLIYAYASFHVGDVNRDSCEPYEEAQALGVRLRAYEALGELMGMGLEPSSVQRDVSSGFGTALNFIDSDADSEVTPAELLQLSLLSSEATGTNAAGDSAPAAADRTPADVLGDFVRDSMEIMNLRADDPFFTELPGIPRAELIELADEAPLFVTFEDMAELTQAYCTNDGIGQALAAVLEAASSAEERGDITARDKILEAWRQQISAQSGKSLFPGQAQMLVQLSFVLQQSPGD